MAHPRSRGENLLLAVHKVGSEGSSPLTRGKQGDAIQVFLDARLIPAHAGKTSPTRRGPGPHTAHPRSRGENGTVEIPEWRLDGSSPLTRGKRRSACLARR